MSWKDYETDEIISDDEFEEACMDCSYYIYDNDEEEFIGMMFATFDGAESWIENCLGNDFERYHIFEKLS